MMLMLVIIVTNIEMVVIIMMNDAVAHITVVMKIGFHHVTLRLPFWECLEVLRETSQPYITFAAMILKEY